MRLGQRQPAGNIPEFDIMKKEGKSLKWNYQHGLLKDALGH